MPPTNPPLNAIQLTSIKDFLRKVMPFLKSISAWTPSLVDDAAVNLIETWLAENP